MDAQLTLNDKQKLIDIFTEFYSQEDIFAIGRLIGIDKSRYYGFGMNAVQLSEAFINTVVQNEKTGTMFEILKMHEKYYRIALEGFISVQEIREKNYQSGLKAIIIGIDEYNLAGGTKNLNFASADAEELAIFLKNKWGVNSSDILKFTQKAFYLDIMKEVRRMCSSLTENDNLLFFFSGHGAEQGGHSYLAVTDTDFDSVGNILNAISLEELNSIIKSCKANLKIRFFDACHCGERFSKEIGTEEKMTEVMKKDFLAAGNGWITFCSCDVDEYSNELPSLKHGAFTYYLLQGLNGAAKRGTGKMYIEDLKIYVCDKVPQIASPLEPQNPQYHCEIEGNIVIE